MVSIWQMHIRVFLFRVYILDDVSPTIERLIENHALNAMKETQMINNIKLPELDQ